MKEVQDSEVMFERCLFMRRRHWEDDLLRLRDPEDPL
jgi:hypothetical protein